MCSDSTQQQFSIAAAERDTGLSKDTLRVWERRYGFPKPERDHLGDRCYSIDQIEKLRIIKRLLDKGFRPGRIVQLNLTELRSMTQRGDSPGEAVVDSDLEQFIRLIQTHEIEELRESFDKKLAQIGLSAFITNVAAPLTFWVGEAWMRAELQIFEEHLFSECLSRMLRAAITDIAEHEKPVDPLVLLTTFPQESHSLGLLMAESIFVNQKARCLSLGTQTPIPDIAQAAQAHGAQIVALSFSSVMNPKQVADGLLTLRQMLDQKIEIWAGGSNAMLRRLELNGLVVLKNFHEISENLTGWRQRRH
jgi:DNA-binding transcriptional MerR regulator/methylmalonyl-CoA mutase cobalamin-binding subunit